jgi:ABC-type microcin C transport system duplicated ATPase subunit YejF
MKVRRFFDPQWSVERLIAEPFYLMDVPPTAAERRHKVATVLEQVGLSAAAIFASPQHEYTRALLAATPRIGAPWMGTPRMA